MTKGGRMKITTKCKKYQDSVCTCKPANRCCRLLSCSSLLCCNWGWWGEGCWTWSWNFQTFVSSAFASTLQSDSSQSDIFDCKILPEFVFICSFYIVQTSNREHIMEHTVSQIQCHSTGEVFRQNPPLSEKISQKRILALRWWRCTCKCMFCFLHLIRRFWNQTFTCKRMMMWRKNDLSEWRNAWCLVHCVWFVVCCSLFTSFLMFVCWSLVVCCYLFVHCSFYVWWSLFINLPLFFHCPLSVSLFLSLTPVLPLSLVLPLPPCSFIVPFFTIHIAPCYFIVLVL